MSIRMNNYRGRYVPVFERVVLTAKTACRFCQANFESRTRKRRDEYTPEDKAKFMMAKGSQAVRMIVFTGPAGTGYVCLGCACDLKDNLTEVIGG